MVTIPLTHGNKQLFRRHSLRSILEELRDTVGDKVREIDMQQFLVAGDEEILDHVLADVELLPIALRTDLVVRCDPQEIKIKAVPCNVPGYLIEFRLPFTGDPLWNHKPAYSQEPPPLGMVRSNHRNDEPGWLHIAMEVRQSESGEDLQRIYDRNIENIQFHLDSQQREIEKHHEEMKRRLRRAIQQRREGLKRIDAIVAKLDIPLVRNTDAPSIVPLEQRRQLAPPLSTPPSQKPTYAIKEIDYDHILSVIRHEGRTFEATPCTYYVHDEEGLRDMILAHLNGHYKGNATGETFRRKGKADIYIEFEDRTAFIAECKVWHGEKELTNAIDQLFDYLTWRDCRVAIVVFNKHNSHHTDLLDKVPRAIAAHSACQEDLAEQDPGEWRYVFTYPGDPARRLHIHAMLFDLHTDGACLAGADLRNAVLRGARLEGADLTEAQYDENTRWPQGVEITD